MANTSDWAAARAAVEACTACPLRETCRQTVFGVGSETAEVLFVGEGPGKTEDEEGVPFVGPAGKLLDELLAAIGLTREHVYIANIVKCRPPMMTWSKSSSIRCQGKSSSPSWAKALCMACPGANPPT